MPQRHGPDEFFSFTGKKGAVGYIKSYMYTVLVCKKVMCFLNILFLSTLTLKQFILNGVVLKHVVVVLEEKGYLHT